MSQTTIYRKTYLLLSAIIALSIGLRFFHLGSVPVSLYWDEAAHLLELKLLATTGLDQFSRPLFQTSFIGWGDFKLPVYTWLSLPLSLLSLPSQIWVRVLSAASGVATIIGLFSLAGLLGMSLRRRLLTAFAAGISPWLIQFSRAGFEANLALMWLVFATISVLLFIKSNSFTRQKISLISFVLTSLLGLYSYYSFRWAIVGVVIFAIYLTPKIFITKRKMILLAAALVLVALVGLLPQYLGDENAYANRFRLSAKNVFTNTDLITESSRYIEADDRSWLARKLHHRYFYFAHDLTANLLSYFDGNYLLTTGDSNLRHSTGQVGLLYWWQAVGLLAGLVVVLVKNSRLGLGLIFLWLWLIIPGALTYESPHAMRSLDAAIPIMLLLGFGWGGISQLKKTWPILVTLGLVLVATIEFNYYLHDYYTHYPARSAHAWQDGYRQAFEQLNQLVDVASDPIVVSDEYFLPHLYFLLYTDYPLARFQAERTAKFAQTSSYPFDPQLGDNIQFVSQDQVNLTRPDTTYVSSRKLPASPCRFTETPIADSAGQPVFYLYTPR